MNRASSSGFVLPVSLSDLGESVVLLAFLLLFASFTESVEQFLAFGDLVALLTLLPASLWGLGELVCDGPTLHSSA